MRPVKRAVRAGLKAAIAHPPVFRKLCGDSLCVFLYHEVSDKPSEFDALYDLAVPTSVFRDQLRWIKKNFNVVTPAQVLSGDYETPAALITFDDGAPGYFENAVPALRAEGLPSLIFLNMAPVDGEVFWASLICWLCEKDAAFRRALDEKHGGRAPEPAFLACERDFVEDYVEKAGRERIHAAARAFHGRFAERKHLEAAAQDPLVSFGNHLFNHYNAARLTEKELREAFEKNQKELSRYPNFVPFFSYPFGAPKLCFNDRTNALVTGAGAQVVFSAFPLPNVDKRARFFDRIALDGTVRSERDLLFRCLFPLVKRAVLS